jgi:5-methylcytosine-specific restriction endonuclease McrA
MSEGLPATSWLSMHSDYYHPSDRSECATCQEMIAAFGPMPSHAEMADAEEKKGWSRYSKKPIPNRLRRQVFERDGYRCRQCGSPDDLCADHIIPEFRGGPATLENLQTLCRACNVRKGARL